MRDAIIKQALNVSGLISGLDIKVGATTGEDKSFDHFLAYAKEANKIADNLLELDRKLNKGMGEEGEPESESGGSTLSKRFGGNK